MLNLAPTLTLTLTLTPTLALALARPPFTCETPSVMGEAAAAAAAGAEEEPRVAPVPSGRGGVSRNTTPGHSGTRWTRFVCAGVRETEATREHLVRVRVKG